MKHTKGVLLPLRVRDCYLLCNRPPGGVRGLDSGGLGTKVGPTAKMAAFEFEFEQL